MKLHCFDSLGQMNRNNLLDISHRLQKLYPDKKFSTSQWHMSRVQSDVHHCGSFVVLIADLLMKGCEFKNVLGKAKTTEMKEYRKEILAKLRREEDRLQKLGYNFDFPSTPDLRRDNAFKDGNTELCDFVNIVQATETKKDNEIGIPIQYTFIVSVLAPTIVVESGVQTEVAIKEAESKNSRLDVLQGMRTFYSLNTI
jgi:hypothetical protein